MKAVAGKQGQCLIHSALPGVTILQGWHLIVEICYKPDTPLPFTTICLSVSNHILSYTEVHDAVKIAESGILCIATCQFVYDAQFHIAASSLCFLFTSHACIFVYLPFMLTIKTILCDVKLTSIDLFPMQISFITW